MPSLAKSLTRLCRLGSSITLTGTTELEWENYNHELQNQIASDRSKLCSVGSSSNGGESTGSVGEMMASISNTTFNSVHRPLACLQQESKNDDLKYALVVLNQPLQAVRQHLITVWQRSILKAVADGGMNRLYDCMGEDHHNYIPDFISGDFDSIRPELLRYCQKHGARIYETPDQNYTDFTKCLRIVVDEIAKDTLQVDAIVVFGGTNGRFDHVFANVNTLYEANLITNCPVYLIDDQSIGCLLRPGNHVIDVNSGHEGSWCGLLPVGSNCREVTTTGLKWNLDHQPSRFGGLLSTSNTFADGAKEVTIKNDQPLLWTMGIKNCGADSKP